MVTESDALKAEIKFRDKVQEDIPLDNINSISFANGKYWWDHAGQTYGFPITRVWCGAFMEFLNIEFSDSSMFSIKIRHT